MNNTIFNQMLLYKKKLIHLIIYFISILILIVLSKIFFIDSVIYGLLKGNKFNYYQIAYYSYLLILFLTYNKLSRNGQQKIKFIFISFIFGYLSSVLSIITLPLFKTGSIFYNYNNLISLVVKHPEVSLNYLLYAPVISLGWAKGILMGVLVIIGFSFKMAKERTGDR